VNKDKYILCCSELMKSLASSDRGRSFLARNWVLLG